MKKYKKLFLMLILISIVSSSFIVKGITGYIGLANITLPKMQREIKVYTENKGTFSVQTYYNRGTISNSSGNREMVLAAVDGINNSCNGKSAFIKVGDGKYGVWNDSTQCVGIPGKYDLYLKRAGFYLTTASHVGTWYLDDKYLP